MERDNWEFVRDRLKVKEKIKLNWIFTLPSTLTRFHCFITCMKEQNVAKQAEQTGSRAGSLSLSANLCGF